MNNRAPHTAFKPGQSGNPSGRPKSSLGKTLSKIVREKFPGKRFTNEEALCRAIVKRAIEGDKDLIELIFDRLEGKVPQAIQGEISETKRIVLVFPEEKK